MEMEKQHCSRATQQGNHEVLAETARRKYSWPLSTPYLVKISKHSLSILMNCCTSPDTLKAKHLSGTHRD